MSDQVEDAKDSTATNSIAEPWANLIAKINDLEWQLEAKRNRIDALEYALCLCRNEVIEAQRRITVAEARKIKSEEDKVALAV